MNTAKDEARKLIEQLPDEATWTDAMHEPWTENRLTVDLKAVESGRVLAARQACC